jgi:predicted Zn-dependent protease
MLVLLENEAQLAAVIAHEISHATQEHTWRQLNKDKGKRTALLIGGLAAAAFGLYAVSDIIQLTLGAMVNGYQRRLENQADRIGLEYLVAAGYDPREAPRVWKLMAKKYGNAPTNFFWSSHSNNAERRSFLMLDIRNNYSDLNFDQLKKGDESEYQRYVSLTQDAAAKKKKIKVKAA